MEDGSKFTYLLAGIGIGTLIGILFAPRSGDETRQYLSHKATEGTEYLKQKGRQVREHTDGYIAKGKEMMQRQRENLEAAVAAGKQAYQEAVSEPSPIQAKPAGSEV